MVKAIRPVYGIIILLVIKGTVILKTDHFYLQVLRGCLAAASALMFIFAISVVPVADAVAVSFVAPFCYNFWALVLRERVGVRRWTAIAIGFLRV